MTNTDSAESLAAFLTPDETAAQLLKRVSAQPLLTGVPLIDRRIRLRPNHLVLISGTCSSCKTELLIQSAATCILPTQWQGYSIGGLEGSCLFVDLDFKFDLLRLWQVLRSRLKPRLGSEDIGFRGEQLTVAVETVVQECLPRLHLVQCDSSIRFLATLKVMPTLLQSLQEANPVKMLLIDNLAANTQLDRMSKGSEAVLSAQQLNEAVAASFRQILASRVAILATQHVIPRAHDPVALAREVTPHHLQGVMSHHMFTFVPNDGDSANGVVYAAQWLLPQHEAERFQISDGSLDMLS